ncbi:uncharacterized protein MKZ38_010759 [Zalerion maritima]|uniref:Pentatricopeptide repeat-containing protein n=1 Tax=Zalerion maritima TaxID=339359 RepID=A0AAD5S040_9PEZI|nr:uncharacterized protein MKZ38_010759 [Zalerion maritima]
MFLCRECVRKTLLTPTLTQRLYTPTATRKGLPTALDTRLFLATIHTRSQGLSVGAKPQKSLTRLEAAVSKAINYHKDPYTVAQYVQSVLKQGRYNEAVEVVKQATSKGMDVVVSWNHLIDYNMANNHSRVALKLFTDLKKRGQLPNAQTYTAIFNGCAKLENPKPFLAEALRIYYLMRENKRLSPNIVHVNALLNACARAGDIEALYIVLGDVTETGPMAPDSRTFTVVFNSLRSIYQRPSITSSEIDTIQHEKERSATLYRSSKIWADARRRWMSAKLVLDEMAVCAYGRLVLETGSREGLEQVFNLVHETMNVPDPNGLLDAYPAGSSLATTTRSQASYVKPGNNALSLLLTACEHPQKTGQASAYWRILTGPPFRVTPDSASWHQYLRTLRRAHNSAKSLQAVLAMPPRFVAARTFRIAMATCARDNLNLNSFANAGRMLDVMTHTLRVPDPHSLRIYLRTATLTGRRTFQERGELGMAEYARQLTRSLEKVWDPFKIAWDQAFGGPPLWNIPNLADEAVRESLKKARDAELKEKSENRERGYKALNLTAMSKEDEAFDREEEVWLGKGQKEQESKSIAKHMVQYNDQREVVAVARRMLAMFDRVVDLGGSDMTKSDIGLFKKRRNELNGRVVKFFEGRELQQPNLPSAIRKAQLEKERMRIDQARTRYQKPRPHRYTTL